MNRLHKAQLTAAGLLVLSGLASVRTGSVWPLLAAGILLTLIFRFRAPTRPVGLLAETLAAALAIILALNSFGLAVIFVYKSLIALALLLILLLEKDGLFRDLIRRGRFYENIRLCCLAALIGLAVVTAGHFLYRGEGFRIVQAPLEVLVLVGIGWALLNTVSEEFIYRGVLYSRLKENVGATGAIVGQAVLFGLAHFWTKVSLGSSAAILGFLFALSLGWLVKRTGSLMAAVFVHFWVDLALFFTVLLRQ